MVVGTYSTLRDKGDDRLLFPADLCWRHLVTNVIGVGVREWFGCLFFIVGWSVSDVAWLCSRWLFCSVDFTVEPGNLVGQDLLGWSNAYLAFMREDTHVCLHHTIFQYIVSG